MQSKIENIYLSLDNLKMTNGLYEKISMLLEASITIGNFFCQNRIITPRILSSNFISVNKSNNFYLHMKFTSL